MSGLAPQVASAQGRPAVTGAFVGTESERRALASLATDIDAILSQESFEDVSWGVSVISCETGEALYSRAERQNRQVASNIKLLTTGVALQQLGSSHRFITEAFISGTVSPAGVLDGDLIIRCFGDPSLSPTYGIDPHEVIRSWTRMLEDRGIRSIRNVIVDASAFDAVPYAPGWAWDDEGFGFNAPVSAAAMYDNSVAVTVSPGRLPGASVQIDLYPSTSYVTLKVVAVTTRSDSVSTIDIRRERGSSTVVVSGNIALGSPSYTEYVSIERPPSFVATLTKEELERAGITVTGSPLDVSEIAERVDYRGLRSVGVHRSPPLKDIVAVINKQSLNLGAEMLVKGVGRERTGIGSTAAGLGVIRQTLTSVGIDVDHIRLYDGSGLARANMIAPADLTTFLRATRRSPVANDFLSSLSVAGRDGTLARRLRSTLAENNVIAKTGYLSGIRAVSGYVRTRDGEWIAFSIVANNYSAPTSVVNTAQDLILMRLASFTRKS